MVAVIRFNAEDAGLDAPEIDCAALLEQLPGPVAYFNAEHQLSLCNRSFREAFPAIVQEKLLADSGHGQWGVAVCAPPSLKTGPIDLFHDMPQLDSARYLAGQSHATADGGMLLTYHDVTAFKVTEKMLRRDIDNLNQALIAAIAARQAALKSLRDRTGFFASISHELRAPLNAILGFSEILQKEMFGPLGSDHYRDYANIIHKSGGHLLSLINDLLDMAKLDAGKLDLHFEQIELLQVIIDCVRNVETQASKSQVGISVNLYNGVNQMCGDHKRLQQMLLNLLSNAVKFTPRGGAVNVSAYRTGKSIAISVSDTGIGIAENDLPKVLEPFGQVDSPLGRQADGTGLGLPLTKELAELHGGSMSIESAKDVGTTVTILFPADDAGHALAS